MRLETVPKEEAKRVIAVRPKGMKGWAYGDDLDALVDYFEVGEVFEVKFEMKTQAEIEAMPEFCGW